MNLNKLSSIASRIVVIGAFVLIGLAVIEYIANLLGYTVLRHLYTAGRLIELAATLLVFVIAMLLRQIRDELRKKA
jgi:phage-related holin